MSRLYRLLTVGGAIGGGVLLATVAVLGAAGFRINTTPSIPVGIYVTASGSFERGAYVMFCPPPGEAFSQVRHRGYVGPGFCPGGYGYLMKRVLAAKGDRVSIRAEGVRVNGRLLPLSQPLRIDAAGRPLAYFPVDEQWLEDDQVLVMSDVNPKSYDGRYFGPIRFSQIKTVVVPVITW